MKVASKEIYSKSIVSLCHFLWRYYCLRLRGVFAYRGYCVICRRQYRSIFIRLAVVASQAPKSAISREITRKFELIAVQVWVSEMWSLTLNILCRTKKIERASNSRLYSIGPTHCHTAYHLVSFCSRTCTFYRWADGQCMIHISGSNNLKTGQRIKSYSSVSNTSSLHQHTHEIWCTVKQRRKPDDLQTFFDYRHTNVQL